MTENALHLRIIENKDWATILFVVAMVIIAITKSAFEIRFAEFTKLLYSNKYIRTYKDNSNLKSSFTIALFAVQIISLAFFIQLTLSTFEIPRKGVAQQFLKTDWILYIRIITFLTFFIFSKFLLEKIIGTAFKIDEFVDQFNLQKATFRTYIGLFLLPLNFILYYNEYISKFFLTVFIILLLTINTITYYTLIKKYQNAIFGKLFYFILYLCTLEIAPYYFMYYWFTKGLA